MAAPNRQCADAALSVADAGGGATDAAVAAMLVAMVTEPGIVSLAGGAYATVWPAGSPSAVIVDGQVAMPGLDRPTDASPPDVRVVRTGYGAGLTMTVGAGSVATPGALAALDLLQSRYGRLPWREVVAPAAACVRDGFVLGAAAGHYLPFVRDTVYAWDARTAAALRDPAGEWVGVGERFAIDDLAATLETIAEEGAGTLYSGALAAALAADQQERGGLVTATDLATYQPQLRDALAFPSGRWELRTNPPPSIGGPVLAALLLLLGDRPRGHWTAEDVAHLVEVQRQVLEFRRRRIDLADDRTAAAQDLLALAGQGISGSASTAHVSVVDSTGTACAITASSGYGSGATVPGTGLWLNNCLGEHELNRGEAPTPGHRLASNMAPTVGRSRDGAVLAIGTPGADRITTALAQVLAAFTRGGAALQEAIDRPRLHVHHLDDDDSTEDGPVRVEVEADLPHPVLDVPVRTHPARSMYFGGVGAALLDERGRLDAAADPRRDGATGISPAAVAAL